MKARLMHRQRAASAACALGADEQTSGSRAADFTRQNGWRLAMAIALAVLGLMSLSGCAVLAGAAAGGAVGYVAGSEAGEDEAREELDEHHEHTHDD